MTTPDLISREAAALLPCPFCGGDALHIFASAGLIACRGCGAETSTLRTRIDAIAAWNRRAIPIAPPAQGHDARAGGWIEAPDIPPELEGKQAWKFVVGYRSAALDVIPRDFSRDKHYCGGIFFWPVDAPLPPGPYGTAIAAPWSVLDEPT